MADSPETQRELVFCHACNDEWFRDENGLQCPRCESEIVEIIDPNSDPRAEANTDNSPSQENDLHPLHHHNPWHDEDAPDPDEGDIDRVEWNGPGRVHFTTTTIHRGNGFSHTEHGQRMGDPFGPLFHGLMGLTSNARNPFQESEHDQRERRSSGPRVRSTFTVNFGGNGGFTRGTVRETDDLAGIFHHIMEEVQGTANPGGGGGGGPGSNSGPNRRPPPMFAMLSQLLNPANARAGDAVFSQEALDRVISGLMEQHSASSAPGPASDGAIAALPKIQIAKEHLDSTGKAECSICMDGLNLGDEVTELPCKHWFHGECVSAWLREHDTCPQCRRGITPKDGDTNSPRATGQAPRFWQMHGNEFDGVHRNEESSTRTPEANRTTTRGSGTLSSPYQVPESPSAGLSGRSHRRENESGRSRFSGWMGRAFGGGSNGSGDSSGSS